MDITNDKDERGRRVIEMRVSIKAPLRAAWEIIANTERLNLELLGMPPLIDPSFTSTSVTGDVDAGLMGSIPFEELPWAFEAPSRYRTVRTFASGPIERFELRCELEEEGAGTKATYAALMTSKSGPVAWAAEKLLAAQVAKGFTKVGEMLEAIEPGRPPTYAQHPDRKGVRERAAKFEPALQANDRVLVEGLCEFIAAGPNDEVAHIQPYALAERWSQPRDAVLALCLDAVGAGLLQMRWETICPSCRGAVHKTNELDEVPDEHTCPVCELDIVASRTSNVAAVFSPVFEVRKAVDRYHCLGSPRRTPHWVAQLVLQPNEQHEMKTTLGPGRYLLQSPGIKARTVLDVGETGDEHVRITLEGVRGERGAVLPAATPPVKAGKVAITLKNEDESNRRMQLVHDGFADLAATAAHVVETDAWKRLHA